jgi:DNA polymerase-3 subunit gamma/tau
MSYLVLARKYRPRTFAEVAGQEVVTNTLQGAIREGRVGHAYLFTGPRGTGKTTSARIFAKALNCERGPLPDPCGECERCRAVDASSDVDVVEIDAASNTGVENIRDLREHAAYTPMRARFKVFIIDEVHMLSKGAFNALLKTLEEPPPHVKFLFATTEINKVPDTILSRCQVLRLSLFSEDEIAERLTRIFGAESVNAASGVAVGLARLARGSMRDALSLCDQLLALVGNEPKLEDVARIAGASASANVALLLDAILAHDAARSLQLLGPLEGGEQEWIGGLLRELRGALLVTICRDDSALSSDFSGDRERLARIGAALGAPKLQLWMEDLLAARERMEDAPSLARTVLELALLDLCRDEKSVPLSVLVQRLAALEQRLHSQPPQTQPRARDASEPATTAAPVRQQVLRPVPPPAPYTTNSSAARGAIGHKPAWEGFLARLGAEDAALGALLARRGQLVDIDAERVHIQLKDLRAPERATFADSGIVRRCESLFEAVLGARLKVVFEDLAQRPSGEKDPFTRSVAQLFGGKIEDKS